MLFTSNVLGIEVAAAVAGVVVLDPPRTGAKPATGGKITRNGDGSKAPQELYAIHNDLADITA